MKNVVFIKITLIVLLLSTQISYAIISLSHHRTLFFITINDTILAPSTSLFKKNTISTTETLPTIKATGSQVYCTHASLPIVTDITITDPSKTVTDAIYIQISTGYVDSQDILTLNGSHPKINSNWDKITGRLTLTSKNEGELIPYTDFITAIKSVFYTNSSNKPTGNRTFSISTDKLSFLPSNQHFYEFVPTIGKAPDLGIDWGKANDLADKRTYHGLKGYLATILTADENQLAATQQTVTGGGWIGGSDIGEEGIWKWMTGPEKGTMFFYNLQSTPVMGLYISNPRAIGHSDNYANWNRSSYNWYNGIPFYEPDNIYNLFKEDEDYAIIIENDGKGTIGSWNDLNYNGESINGSQQANGYIVEYGGMPGDPEINIATSTSIIIPQITTISESNRCGSGNLTLQATSNLGTINWFENETGGSPIGMGTSFTTPTINKSTTYYIDTEYSSCHDYSTRTPITATIYTIPEITTNYSRFTMCGPGYVFLEANTSEGTIYWYDDPDGNNLVSIGTSIYRVISANTTYYIEAVNHNCTTGSKEPVEIVVYSPPIIPDEKVVICTSKKLTIDAKISEIGMSYLWSTGERKQTIEISKPGVYTVDITRAAPESCTVRKTITVIENPAPKIESITTDDTAVTIRLGNPSALYEYSIDNINYQSSNVFADSPAGIQTAYVREIGNCNTVSENYVVIKTPKFFTPNNDNFNDFWNIEGVVNYPDATISIYDRYGKLVKELSPNSIGWDGTFNGQELPASDYWYVFKMDATAPEKRGHFSLKR
jgi:gliding motility-associated-like protein